MAQTRRVELAVDPAAAFHKVRDAIVRTGKLEEENEVTRSLRAKLRHGLNPVRLRLTVLSGAQPNSAILEIVATGQDVMGAAARKATDKLVDAIR